MAVDPNTPPQAPSPTPTETVDETGLSAQFDLTTNYIFRGISQSDNLPAAQGGFTYTFKPGLYFNVWGSNVRQVDTEGNIGTVEIDTVAGVRNSIGDNFSYDISLARYNYPKIRLSYNELLINLAYRFLFAKFGYSPNVFNVHETGVYSSVGVNFDIPPFFSLTDVSFCASVGHYSLPATAGQSYNDYSMQFSKKFYKYYTIAIQWTGTNNRFNAGALDDDHIIGTLTVDV